MQAPEVDVGTVIGGTYEATRLIGRGGMGEVWQAKHLRLPGKRVALKVLLRSAAGDPESLARFRREAEIASSLGHPNIIQVLDFNTLPSGTPYQVLELLQGEDLAKRLKRGKLRLDEALGIARQIGSALTAAHRHDVVHRDLKPANIFLCPDEEGGDLVKILDFGVSKIQGSHSLKTKEEVLLGTPPYMSPEQASGKNQELDQRTDLFALGSIVYEMLTGRRAFAGNDLVSAVFQVVYEQPVPLAQLAPSLPPHVVAAVERAMAKHLAVRYPDVASFIADLTGQPLTNFEVVEPSWRTAEAAQPKTVPDRKPATPVTEPPTTPDVAPPALAPRRAVRRIALVALVLGGAGAAGVGGWRIGRVKPPQGMVPRPPPPAGTLIAPPDLGAPRDLALPPPLEDSPPVAVPGRPVHAVPLPPLVRADLDAAERALANGDADGALPLARRTLLVKRSSRAFAIIARAYCLQGDLGDALAAFHSVGPADRPHVERACKARGITLKE